MNSSVSSAPGQIPADLAGEDQSIGARVWFLISTLYTTQFLSLGFFLVTLTAVLREQNVPVETVGLVYLLGLVWPLKPLWAPLVDRISFGRPGHYRIWLLLCQSLVVILLVCIGQLDPGADFGLVFGLCFLVALASATQDVAIDGLACRLLPPARRGLANGVQMAGGLIGNLLGGGAMLMAYPHLGWRGCLLALAAVTALPVVQLLFFREPLWPRSHLSVGALFLRAGRFWRLPGKGGWLGLLLLFPVGNGIAYGIMTPLLVDAGWPLERIGLIANTFGSLAGIAAALATGWLAGHVSRRRLLTSAAVVQIAGVLALAIPAAGYTGEIAGGAAVILFFCCYNPASTVLAILMMDHASSGSPATDYTLQSSLNQLVAIVMMSAGAALVPVTGYGGAVAAGAIAAVLAALLSFRHQLPEQASSRA